MCVCRLGTAKEREVGLFEREVFDGFIAAGCEAPDSKEGGDSDVVGRR